jgi:hypothetical protein
MAELSESRRDKLDDSDFAYVDKDGERHLPIHDESHVRNAVARFGQTNFDSASDKKKAARAITKAAKDHGIDLSDDDEVMKAASS